MSKCEMCIKLATELAALKSERNTLRSSLASTSKRLKSYEGAVTTAQVNRLTDKAERKHKRLLAAVARTEEKVKRAKWVNDSLRLDIEELKQERTNTYALLAEKNGIITRLKTELSEGTGRMDKKAVLLLRRVKKHLSNPKTGVPFKGAEALCKEIDRALVGV